MVQVKLEDRKQTIIRDFALLLSQYQQQKSRVATREEEAEKEKNQELLEIASTYTIDSIVKGIADLQLNFSSVIEELANNLVEETTKLDQLKRAIAVEKDNLGQLQEIRLVADALHILRQEHQEQLKLLSDSTEAQQEAIEKEMAQTRKEWEKEQEEFELYVEEDNKILLKQREQEEADYQYKVERDRQIEIDEYEEYKRTQERELAEENSEKEKIWREREQYLNAHAEEFAEHQKQIETYEEQLKQATNIARGEAIQEVSRDAKVKADLFEKEWESTQQGYELKIQSLESTLERQTEQIADITQQLQAAVKQAQDLAMRAFQSSNT